MEDGKNVGYSEIHTGLQDTVHGGIHDYIKNILKMSSKRDCTFIPCLVIQLAYRELEPDSLNSITIIMGC